MSDSYGDGWEGTVIGIRQNGIVTSTFGNQFNSGTNYGPVFINVKKNVSAELVVTQISFFTEEIAFSLYNEND